MRHILSWVTTRSSLLNRIFAAPGGQYRRLCFLIWFETLCASELFRVTGKSNCTGSILVSRTYKVLLLFGIRVSSCSSIGDLVVKIWLTSRSSLPFLDATVIIWHYRSNCTDQKITDYFRWINRWVTIPNFLRRYEDEPPEADIEVQIHCYFHILLLLFRGRACSLTGLLLLNRKGLKKILRTMRMPPMIW